jgi:hypothetical protein
MHWNAWVAGAGGGETPPRPAINLENPKSKRLTETGQTTDRDPEKISFAKCGKHTLPDNETIRSAKTKI